MGVLVLTYHSYHSKFAQYFESHVKYVKKHFHPLSPQEFYEWKEVGEFVEIGSHTLSHAEIFVSNLLTGFVTPINGEIKKMYCMVKGVKYRAGFPLYQRGPELVNRQVFPPDEPIKAIGEAAEGIGFSEQRDWCKHLENIVRYNPYPYELGTDEMRKGRIRREILESKLDVERMTNKECRFFAYLGELITTK